MVLVALLLAILALAAVGNGRFRVGPTCFFCRDQERIDPKGVDQRLDMAFNL